MKKTPILRQLLLCCFVLLGVMSTAIAQTVVGINGPVNVCQGSTTAYTPATALNPAFNYTWTVSPTSAGTVLSGNISGSNIQWTNVGPANVVLTGRNPANGNAIVVTGSLGITVNALPAPSVTSNVRLACQPLEDSFRKEGQRPVTPQFDTSSCQWVCANSYVTYTANGNPGSTYTWTATGSVSISPSGNTCSIGWGAPGDGMVTVTETTAAGCTASTSFCVKIVAGPTAKFEAQPVQRDPIVICKNGELVLIDQSTGTTESPIVSWHWDFGDGQVSNQSPGAANNPISHQYTTPGDYSVMLTVTNSCGCSSSFKRRVRVLDPEAPVITCPRVVCEKERAQYFVNRPCSPGSWSVIGGTIVTATAQTAIIVWDNVDPSTGFGYVMYKSCAPCPMTVVEPVPVILQRAKIQGSTTICEGEQYVYRLPKWPATKFDWSVSSSGGTATLNSTDQRNEIALTATGPGTITLTCKYENTMLPCGGSATITINILPKANITGSQLLCQGQSANYAIGGYTGTWSLTDPANNPAGSGTGTTFTGTFSQAGVYRLSVTGSTFCPPAQYLIKVVGTPAPPTSITGPNGACAGIPVQYSAGAPIPGTSFQWSVSGGGTANAPVGSESYITFAGAPNYTITVRRVTTDAAQCLSAPLTKIVTDPVPALVTTGPDTVCHSTSAAYSINYQGGDAYEWGVTPSYLGSVVSNGSTYNPTVLWNIPAGTGAVATLYARIKKCNAYRTDSFKVFVRGVPNFVAKLRSGLPDTTVCSGVPVTLIVVPSYPVGSVTSVSWEWGDGNQTIPGPTFGGTYSHAYNTEGAGSPVAFVPVITITNPNGCAGTTTVTGPTINVKPAPVAHVSPDGPLVHCGPFSGDVLTATITTGVGGSNTYAWTPAISTTPVCTATAYGSYSVLVTNSNGCSRMSNTVNIIERCTPTPCGPGTPPVISGGGSNNCGSVNVNVTVSGATVGYDWFYPPGATVVGSPSATNLNVTFTEAGNYQFTYRAYYLNNAGATCYVDKYIMVLVPYIADLRYNIVCNQAGGNYKIILQDHTNQYPGIGLNRTYYNASWTSVGTGFSATVFAAGGTSNTYYEVIQDNTFTHPACTATVNITLPAFPAAAFNLLPGIPNPGCVSDVAFNFNNTSTGLGLGYLWNYGTAQNQNPVGGVVYANPYSGPVTLTVTDKYGCTSTASTPINAVANPYSGTMTAAPNPTCQGTAVTLAYAPSTGGLMPSGTGTYTWYNENAALFTSTAPTATYSVFTPGGYWVKGKGNFGCEVETPVVPVVIKQVPAISISGNTKQCVGVPFVLTTQTIAGATYVWSPGGSGGASLNQTLSTPGTYTYTVTITVNGCSRTSPPFTVTVNPLPAPPSLSFNVVNCNPYELQLNASGVAGTYNWNNGLSGSSVNVYAGGPYQVVLTDINGCMSSSAFSVPSDPAEYLWVFPTGCFCKTELRKPYVIGPIIPFNYWEWNQNGGVAASGSGVMPDFYVNPGSVYNMTLDNGYCHVTSGDMYFDSDTCRKLDQPAKADVAAAGVRGNLGTAMQLIPNPAREMATVVYSFTPGSTNRTIEVYDMVGRMLQTHTVTNENGRLVLPMERFSAGMYQVVMKENGIMVQQSKLSLTR